MGIDLVTLVVADYDTAIEFFTGALGFDLVQDVPARTRAGVVGAGLLICAQRGAWQVHRVLPFARVTRFRTL
jgi:catechol 2,3-dioxygenase-like lactoylglutathione lyase family enzyme